MGNLRHDMSDPGAQPFLLEGGGHAVLLIHGFTGTPGHMRLLGEALAARGMTARALLLPGHGRTPEAMKASDWTQWLYAAREAADSMRRRYDHLTVCGLSMGGLLALLLAGSMQADACVTLSAPMHTQNAFIALSRVAAPFHPMMRWRDEPARAQALNARYDIGYDRFPTARAGDLKHLMDMARRNLFAVTCPVLAVQSHADRTVRADSADIIMRGVSSKQKEQMWLDTAPHVCTLSPDVERIAARMDAFLRGVPAAGKD